MAKQLLIGGQALVKLGSSRSTLDTDYLTFIEGNENAFVFDKEKNTDYVNANGNKFFAEIWAMEANNISEIASPQALLELKAYSFVQHCLNGFWQKADDAEYDIKFLVRTFNLSGLKVANKYLAKGEMEEINKVIKSVRK